MYPIIRSRDGLAAPAAVLLAVAGLLAAPSGAAQDAPQQAPPPSANPDPNRPVKSPGNAKWAQTAEEARQRAAAENKLVFYEFESPGCDGCRRMQGLLYPAFDFEARTTSRRSRSTSRTRSRCRSSTVWPRRLRS